MSASGSPVYPGDYNTNRNNATVCAATDRVCRIPNDIWNAPDGVMGIGFDDGPTPVSTREMCLFVFLVPPLFFVKSMRGQMRVPRWDGWLDRWTG